MFLATSAPKPRYAATFFAVMGVFSNGALPASQVSANVASDTSRVSAVASYAMIGNLAGLVSTWSFLPLQAPYYGIGNVLNLSSHVMVLLLGISIHLWFTRDNKKREKRHAEVELSGMTHEQIQNLEWKHPDFRWRL